MKTVLFQGDSITDAGRSRENDHDIGTGYPLFVAADMGVKYPQEFRFLNRGISGNRITDIDARIKRDIINLKPDYLTILIGINDVWHEIGDRNGVDNKKFFRVYSSIIEEVKTRLPDIKIITLEPFVLKAAATENAWGIFRRETEMRAQSAKAIAEKYNLTFIPLQEKFDELEKTATASYWLGDGVHPTAAGHRIIADEVTKALEEVING